ncbi:MAG: ferrochelatase, partial [Campylobacterales bacterium]
MERAVVLANMGGARSLEELKLFLKNMFSDPRIVRGPLRPLLSRVIPIFRGPKVWKKYQQIGGSRLHRLTE